MKICAFEVRDREHAAFAEAEQSTQEKYSLLLREDMLTLETAQALWGVDAVSILDSVLNVPVLDALHQAGVRYITTRTIGYELIDIPYAKSLGLRVSNASYPPNGVAEYTLMLMLLCLRHYKAALYRINVNDYSLHGLIGRELGNLTVGIAGTGEIGAAVIRLLKGFGCTILAYNRSINPDIAPLVHYVPLKELFQKSDILSFHLPLTDQTRHMVNDESLNQMKDGVVLINTARGALLRTETLIKGIEQQKIGALGLDVLEEEKEIYHRNRVTDIIPNRAMAYLRQFPNVVMTQHMAFLTSDNIRSMVLGSLENLYAMHTGQPAREL